MFRPFMLIVHAYRSCLSFYFMLIVHAYNASLRLNLNSWVQDDCKFMAGFGESVEKMHPPGHDIVAFRCFHRVNIV